MAPDVAVARLADLIRENQPCVVLTGAGVSTESGVPDFRSPTGIWAEFDPLEYATLGAFRRDPAKVWRFYAPRFAMLTEAGDGAPHCPACGAILKPDVVFFDELLPPEAIDRAYELAGAAALLLVVGSSLEVYPVAELPRTTLEAGGKVAVVNRTPTWVGGREPD